MVSITHSDGRVRQFSLSGALGLLFAVAAVGGFAGNLLTWVGARGQSPGVRFEALERKDSILARADSVQSARITDTLAQLDALNELTERMAALRCLDPASRLVVIQAQVPCARIFRDLGMQQ